MALSRQDDAPYEIKPLAAEDAGLVGDLFRAVYGNDYPYEEVYQPEALRLNIISGRLSALLATDPAGRPVGYFARARTAPNRRLWEEKSLAVLPEYNHTPLALDLLSRLQGALPPDADGIFSTAVCHHYFTQMVCAKGGRHDCALALDHIDGAIFRGRPAEPRRIACLLNFSEQTDPVSPLFLPPEYAAMLTRLAAPLRPRISRAADGALPAGGLTVISGEPWLATRTWSVSVHKLGADWPTVLARLMTEATRLGVISLLVTVIASRPSVGAAVTLLRRKGFFFSGLAPRWFGADGIVLQTVLGSEPDYEGIKLYTPTARDLLSFIRSDRDTVGLLANKAN